MIEFNERLLKKERLKNNRRVCACVIEKKYEIWEVEIDKNWKGGFPSKKFPINTTLQNW